MSCRCVFVLAASLACAVAGWELSGTAQSDPDFVFKDDEGHLVLRFAGTEAAHLDRNQLDEVSNAQLSTMVHDRLRADWLFEAEAVDAQWAHPMEARLTRHLVETAPEISTVHAECRTNACRLVLEHAGGRTVAEHRALMTTAQRSIRAFVDANAPAFQPGFMIAAHYQDPAAPYLKVFLRRGPSETWSGPPTGG